MLVGFDNWTVMAEASRPPLTTIDMNLAQIGKTAAQILLAAIDGHSTHGTRLVPCQLVIRASTRAPDHAYKGALPVSVSASQDVRAPSEKEN
jgi:LacI family transcriptional regulator